MSKAKDLVIKTVKASIGNAFVMYNHYAGEGGAEPTLTLQSET